MAIPLSRIPWRYFRKNHLHCSQILIVPCIDRVTPIKLFSTYRQKPKSSNKFVTKFLTYTIVASGFGFVLYKWKDDFLNHFNIFESHVPKVQAKSIHVSNISHNRDRFNFIADVVESSVPAVVYIEIKDNKRFDVFTGKPITYSNGSGFIVEKDGLILTNAHVVNKPNTTVKVRLYDGSTYTGIIEDIDVQSDLATVRINKINLPTLKLGSSANIRPGEFVVAIGSPLSLSNSITSGVVSSANRPSEELGLYNRNLNYIQTDAAITFGNSGGPLVNLNGEAIGVNAMKVTAGISFAIPIDYAKEFLKKAESRRKDKGSQNVNVLGKRRYLGVTMLTLTPDLIMEMHQKSGGLSSAVSHGVLIWKIYTGSPAHMGGLRSGDVITHVNREPITNVVSIYKALEQAGIINLTVVRGMQVLHLKIEPEEI